MLNRENQTIVLKDGRLLGFAEYGDPKGKPVFFFHGWPSARLQPELIHRITKKQKIRLISVDRPGYGLSTYKEGRTMVDWPDDVVNLANKLHIKKFAVAGVSGGGPYAAVCAYKIPERLTKTAIIVGLGPTWIPGILNGISPFAKLLWGNYAKYPWLRYFAGLWYYLLAKYFPFLFVGYIFLQRSNADKKASIHLLGKSTNKDITNIKEIFRQGLRGAVLDLYLYTKDWGFKLEDIKTKVYLFYGEEDENVSLTMGRYYHKKIKGSVLKTYPNEGHLIALTHAEEIFKTLIK